MQPLKRFTQCGSLTMLFTVFIVLFGVSSTALTTFGKIPNTPQSTAAPVKGRPCSTNAECETFENTSCVKDPSDAITRCLCGDNIAPVNGQCTARYKSLRHMCDSSSECLIGMVCTIDNSTRSGFGKIAHSSVKQCLCEDEKGYKENLLTYTCDSGVQLLTNILMPLLSIIVSYFISSPRIYFGSHQ